MDLVTFGEAMLRLTPPVSQTLGEAHRFDVYVGGAELNVAVAAARLGLETRWVSRLPDNALGRMVADRASEVGVDVSLVAWSPNDRLGLYFVELGGGGGPRAAEIVYDRSGSAMAHIAPRIIDWERALRGAKWFHVSGITPALSDSAAATLLEGLAAAKAESVTVSYDLNFRAKLWSSEHARRAQEPLMRYVDVLIASEDASGAVFGAAGDGPEAVARELLRMLGVPTVVVTGRERDRSSTRTLTWRAVVLAGRGRELYRAPEVRVDVAEPIGAGDAFVAGLIHGRIRHDSWDEGVRCGAALVTLKYATPGDFSQASIDDVERFLASAPVPSASR